MNNSMKLSIAVVFLAAVTASCNRSRNTVAEESDEPVYEATVIKKVEVSGNLTLPGELEGYYETGIVAKVNGYIKRMMVDIGDHVSEGQLLVELEAPELISQLATSLSEYQAKEAIFLNTKGKYVRLQQTNKTAGAVSPYDMDMTRTSMTSDSLGYRAAYAKYESVKDLVAYLRITAPFDGIITERAMAPGAFVGPSDNQKEPILKLKKQSKLRLHIAVPEKHLAEVSVGELVKFHVKSFPGETFEGKITRLAKNLNVMTRSETIEMEIDNKQERLLPGMYANASLPIKRTGESIVVPKTAVVTNMEKQFVIKIVHGSIVQYIDVEKGEDQQDGVEIFGPVSAGDTILNTASDELKEKSKIKIVVVAKSDLKK